jgi:hypothetical protein
MLLDALHGLVRVGHSMLAVIYKRNNSPKCNLFNLLTGYGPITLPLRHFAFLLIR